MLSDLTLFAARLREFIGVCSQEPGWALGRPDAALREHCDIEFNGLALVLFALQFEHNLPYRKFCEARGVRPERLTHWTQAPALPTAAFKELALTCLPEEKRTAVFHSSGTTEQRPSRHFHSPESLAVYEASALAGFQARMTDPIPVDGPARLAAGSPTPNAPLLFLTPPPSQAPRSSLVWMFDAVRRSWEAPESAFVSESAEDGTWALRCDSAIQNLNELCRRGRAAIVLGAAFSFVHLLDFLVERNLRFALPAGTRAMETGGYKGRSRSLSKNELHGLITDRLGILPDRIVCEYGMSELSAQAYNAEASASGAFHFPLWARARVISAETGAEVADGETGLLRIVDLANVFSVLAVQTEDLAIRRGTGFELLGRAPAAEPRGCSLMPQANFAPDKRRPIQ